jgi:hypothetical protein
MSSEEPAMPVTVRRYTSLLLVIVLLSACDGFRGAPLANHPTRREVNQSLGEMTRTLGVLTSQLASDPAVVAMNNLPHGLPFSSLTPLAVRSLGAPQRTSLAFSSSGVTEARLPRGNYTYNERTGVWDEQPAPTGDLTITWVYDGVPSELTVKWEVESDTAFVVVAVECVNAMRDCEAQLQELPTSLNAVLMVGSEEAADLTVRATYHETVCGYLTYEPTNLSVEGALGQDTAVALEADFIVTTEDGVDTAASSLLLTAAAGRDRASFDWSWGVSGVIARDEHCFPAGAASIAGGNLSLGFHSVIDNKASSFSFVSGVSEVMQDEDGVPQSAQVEGHVDIDEERAVDFTGRLDDENEDGVPGENVLLTFADGTTTLEAFLFEQMMRAAASLGARFAAPTAFD